jgi:hypothetical protein
MKPAWDKLGDEFAASSSVLIGDVDCTASGEELCTKFEIRGCTYRHLSVISNIPILDDKDLKLSFSALSFVAAHRSRD